MRIEDLSALEKESKERKIPVLGSLKGQWLLEHVQLHRPRRVLELGTANGYSGMILGSCGASLLTVEKGQTLADEAWEHFRKAKVDATVFVGDGVLEVSKLVSDGCHEEYFQLVFIDFAKRKYIKVLEDCIRLLASGGYLIADNISMEGCADFKEAVLSHPLLDTKIIDIEDGLSCSRKR